MNTQLPSIMYVDDNHCYQRYLEFVLGDRFSLTFANTGEECIERYKEALVDLVLIDSALPDISSTEVCEILKDDPVMVNVPVIFLTESDSQSERNSAYRSGVDDYLSKTISPNELSFVVDVALDYPN